MRILADPHFPARTESWQDQAQASASHERGLSRLLIAYVATGLAFMLVPGTLIGFWNLISISGARSPEAAQAAWVQAHGHAQVFGWVGSFILGIGFYSIPKLQRLPRFPISAGWVCWALWAPGVLVRWGIGFLPWNWRVLLPLSALAELSAFLIFFTSVSGAHSSDRKKTTEPWVVAVLVGTGGFLLALALNLVQCTRLALAGHVPVFPHAFDQRFLFVATWGFLVPFVWGFSSRWMPVFLGLQPQRGAMFLAAVALEACGVVSALAGWFRPGSFLILVGAAMAIVALRLWEPSAQPPKVQGVHPTFRAFVRISYGWLVSAALLGIWAAAVNGPGIWGASRHALTVGFVATMVFSVGPRVLPAFSGLKPLFSKRLVFVAQTLLTCGCGIRVTCELLAYQGYAAWAWQGLPLSAGIELAAVFTFATNMMLTLTRGSSVPLRGD